MGALDGLGLVESEKFARIFTFRFSGFREGVFIGVKEGNIVRLEAWIHSLGTQTSFLSNGWESKPVCSIWFGLPNDSIVNVMVFFHIENLSHV